MPLPDPGPPSTNPTLWRGGAAAPPLPPLAAGGAAVCGGNAGERPTGARCGSSSVRSTALCCCWRQQTQVGWRPSSQLPLVHPPPPSAWALTLGSVATAVAVQPALGACATVIRPAAAKPSETLPQGNCRVQEAVAAAAAGRSAAATGRHRVVASSGCCARSSRLASRDPQAHPAAAVEAAARRGGGGCRVGCEGAAPERAAAVATGCLLGKCSCRLHQAPSHGHVAGGVSVVGEEPADAERG